MLPRPLRHASFFALVTTALVGAHCGGKIGGVASAGDKDAGLAGQDGAVLGDDSGADDSSAGDDSGVEMTGTCPLPGTVITLGASCDWGGGAECTVALDACDTGSGTSTLCECLDGTVSLPDGEGIACAGMTGDDSGDACLSECDSTCAGDAVCLQNCEAECEGTTTEDASFPPEGCALGASCSGGTCTNSGAGPCGSDQRLACSGGVYVADGFPCDTPPNEGCGFGGTGTDGCSEECGCVNGLEVCTGNCPDGGPSSP